MRKLLSKITIYFYEDDGVDFSKWIMSRNYLQSSERYVILRMYKEGIFNDMVYDGDYLYTFTLSSFYGVYEITSSAFLDKEIDHDSSL